MYEWLRGGRAIDEAHLPLDVLEKRPNDGGRQTRPRLALDDVGAFRPSGSRPSCPLAASESSTDSKASSA
jgi:hypothetical protein